MIRYLTPALALLMVACAAEDDPATTATDAATPDSATARSDAATMSDVGPDGIALPAIEEAGLREHLSVLASDEFEGRAPATKGGKKTREYLIAEMKRIGLEPANGDSYEQPVGLVEQTMIPQQSSLSLTKPDGSTWPLTYRQDAVYWSKQVKQDISIEDSELVFVGFGVVAPEYGWNDYEGLDVEGKTVVMLVNDPGFYLEDELFNGRSMTYYGRWTYKYEEAARQGAAAALVIHETDPAAYGWGVVEGSWSGPQLDLERPDEGASRIPLEGWITKDVAEAIFEDAGLDYAEAKQAALSPDFTPMPLTGFSATATMKNAINRSESANVAGKLVGTKHPDDYVLYMAHWDHLGKTFAAVGGDTKDTIHNGAVDNATGTAGLLGIAESFANAAVPPERSILFLAVTAEESGLLGSAYFGETPLVPFKNIVGGINMDAVAPSGPAKDLIVVGYGASELEDILKTVAEADGKYLRPDASPEKGYFYRSDHISLAKKGVPMLYLDVGIDKIEGGEEAGRAWDEEYTANRYHKPADEYDESWDMRGLVETFSIMRDVGKTLAYSEDWPTWYDGNEFRALRDEQMADR
ncbi:M28 family metallopeptidase [Parvularcula sp. LCG005]|uniref:M28 family metallopeptidase n=1 Tax=Parvularcula sp. LCG005 TaxID=3078805 RepID=UPI0029439ED3|nr:M28 family metallopeptidase [Parvularcula sp. LCG005]WOI54181.1 M28 family metallopeptidase [Parvularcula sp. LCG005]